MKEVVKDLHLSQAIAKGSRGNYKATYKLTLEFENAAKIEQKLGIQYKHLIKAFTDRFVPKLMDLALKDIKKADQ